MSLLLDLGTWQCPDGNWPPVPSGIKRFFFLTGSSVPFFTGDPRLPVGDNAKIYHNNNKFSCIRPEAEFRECLYLSGLEKRKA